VRGAPERDDEPEFLDRGCRRERFSSDPTALQTGVVAPVDLDTASDQLYGVPREQFMALRQQLVRQAREGGDPQTAARIAKLTKPTVSAWTANQLARAEQPLVAELVELGVRLRDATRRLDGDDLKALSRERANLIGRLLHLADAGSSGPINAAVARELEEILTAAVADPGTGAALLAGRISSAKDLASGDAWPTVAAGGVPDARPGKPTPTRATAAQSKGVPSPPSKPRRHPSALVTHPGAAVEDARAAMKHAEAQQAQRAQELQRAQSSADEADADVRSLSEQLDAARARARAAGKDLAAARRDVSTSERAADRARRALRTAEATLPL
jgi:hypothetical protein